jgi:hypothetical protein
MGEPLDVFTRLGGVRANHARKSVVAWLFASVSVVVLVLHGGEVLGWPRIEHRVEAEVVRIRQVPDGTVVTFAGHAGGRDIRWSRPEH